jgi:hypothetical protein
VPESKVPGPQSAGVQVQGSANDNGPLDMPAATDGDPSATTIQGNNVQQFAPTLATVEVGAGAKGTTIVGGSGTLIDNGTGTVVQGNFQPPP